MDHMLQCNGLTIQKQEADLDTWLASLHRMARRVENKTNVLPDPAETDIMEEEYEISFDSESSQIVGAEDDAASMDSLGCEEYEGMGPERGDQSEGGDAT